MVSVYFWLKIRTIDDVFKIGEKIIDLIYFLGLDYIFDRLLNHIGCRDGF